jgi:hypothetical protein
VNSPRRSGNQRERGIDISHEIVRFLVEQVRPDVCIGNSEKAGSLSISLSGGAK